MKAERTDWNLAAVLAQRDAVRKEWDTLFQKECEILSRRVALGIWKQLEFFFIKTIENPLHQQISSQMPLHRRISFLITDGKSAKELMKLAEKIDDLPIISQWLQFFSDSDNESDESDEGYLQVMKQWNGAFVLDHSYFNDHMKKVSLKVASLLEGRLEGQQNRPANHRLVFKIFSPNDSPFESGSCVDERHRNDLEIKLWVEERYEKQDWILRDAVLPVFMGLATVYFLCAMGDLFGNTDDK